MERQVPTSLVAAVEADAVAIEENPRTPNVRKLNDLEKGADLSRLMPEHNLFNWIDGVGMFLLLGLGGISTLRRDIW